MPWPNARQPVKRSSKQSEVPKQSEKCSLLSNFFIKEKFCLSARAGKSKVLLILFEVSLHGSETKNLWLYRVTLFGGRAEGRNILKHGIIRTRYILMQNNVWLNRSVNICKRKM